MIDEYGAVDGVRFSGRDQSTRRAPSTVPLCPPQIPHDLNWDRTRAAEVGSRLLTAWAMSRPKHVISHVGCVEISSYRVELICKKWLNVKWGRDLNKNVNWGKGNNLDNYNHMDKVGEEIDVNNLVQVVLYSRSQRPRGLMRAIHDQSCCAKLFCATQVCPFTIKSIMLHNTQCCATWLIVYGPH
jgi:hypothetical protein